MVSYFVCESEVVLVKSEMWYMVKIFTGQLRRTKYHLPVTVLLTVRAQRPCSDGETRAK